MALRQLLEAKSYDSQTMPTRDFVDKAEDSMRAGKETGEQGMNEALNAKSERDLKTIAAISEATKLLDEAIELLTEKNLEDLDLKLWKIAAELEYASFLISVKHGLTNYLKNLSDVNSNGEGLDSVITKTQETLENAAMILRSNPKEAYFRVKKATALVRRAQSILRKTNR